MTTAIVICVSIVVVMSLITFIAYGLDKQRSMNAGRRVPEQTLQILAFLGGWPGPLIGQRQFRHKTKKLPFLIVFWLVVVLHVAIVGLAAYIFFGPSQMDGNGQQMQWHAKNQPTRQSILPKNGKKSELLYEYDFGDSWEHEVLFEGIVGADSKVKYPICLEGARACPPEDCGGIWGYADFVKAMSNKKHERHREMLEWVGGRFDPEDFDAVASTKAMKKGLPNWRSMAGL